MILAREVLKQVVMNQHKPLPNDTETNVAYLIGEIDSEPTLKSTTGGSQLVFKVKTEETYKNKEGKEQVSSTWHRCVVWGHRADSLHKQLHNKQRVHVRGRIRNASYVQEGVRKYISEVVASEVEFVTRERAVGASDLTPRGNGAFQRANPVSPGRDEIPF